MTERNSAAFNEVWQRTRDRICVDCDIDTLLPTFAKETGLQFQKDYSLLQDFVDRFEPNPSIWPVVKRFQEVCKTGLLTNMYPRMLQAIQKQALLPPVQWDVIIDSSIVGYQKPDKRIFEVAEKAAETLKEHILFIDNSSEHVAAVQALGWQGFWYDSASPAESSLKLAEFFEKHR